MIKLIAVELSDFSQAVSIAGVCGKYVPDVSVDAHCGRYIVDAASILGMESLVGNFVSLEPIGVDPDKIKALKRELSEISGVSITC